MSFAKRSSTPDSGCPRFNVFSKELSYVLLAPRIATWQLPDEALMTLNTWLTSSQGLEFSTIEKIAAVQKRPSPRVLPFSLLTESGCVGCAGSGVGTAFFWLLSN